MVWATTGRPAGLLPRLLCDGAEPGWLADIMRAAMQHYWIVLLLLLLTVRAVCTFYSMLFPLKAHETMFINLLLTMSNKILHKILFF